jgi:hypothetical protein
MILTNKFEKYVETRRGDILHFNLTKNTFWVEQVDEKKSRFFLIFEQS